MQPMSKTMTASGPLRAGTFRPAWSTRKQTSGRVGSKIKRSRHEAGPSATKDRREAGPSSISFPTSALVDHRRRRRGTASDAQESKDCREC
jgi:hypothetical protein